MSMDSSSIVITGEFTPQPATNFAQLWGLDADDRNDIEKLNNWCRMGKIPGGFKGPDGKWWVNPLEMLTWNDGKSERQRLHREDSA